MLAATLLMHVIVLQVAHRELDEDLPPLIDSAPVQVFTLPAPVAIGRASAPARSARSARAISKHAPAAAPAPKTPTAPPPEAEAPQPELLAEAPPVTEPPPAEPPAPPAEAAPAPPAPAETEVDRVLVSFPKIGRFTSDTLAARGLLRILGTTVIEWRMGERQYEARSETRDDGGTLWMVLTSSGEVRSDSGVAPLRYTEKMGRRAETATNFQRDAGKVTFSSTTAEYALQEGTQDQLSFMAQLALLAQAFPDRFAPGASIALPVASRRDVRVYDLRVIGWEQISTGVGVVDALRLDRALSPEAREARIELWLVPSLRWLPARTRTTLPNGDLIETVLKEVELVQ